MSRCPRCGERAWHYGLDENGSDAWTCPNGHLTHPARVVDPDNPVLVVDRPWLLPVVCVTGSGLLTLLLNILLN